MDIVAPTPSRFLAMEIERYYRRFREVEALGKRGDELNLLRAEISHRVDLYKLSTSLNYERIKDANKREKQALAILFEELSGHSWKNRFGWVGQAKTMVKPAIRVMEAEVPLYDGVNMSQTDITGLDMDSNGLEGRIPEKIGELTSIKFLNLNFNQIRDPLPSHLGDLLHLEYINLAGNLLRGSLPTTIFTNLSSLRGLDLSFNALSGSIPDIFCSISRLQELNLAGNRLEGSLPPSMSCLVKLRHLNLYSNLLTGDIPNSFSTFTILSTVNISQNRYIYMRLYLINVSSQLSNTHSQINGLTNSAYVLR